MKRYSIQFLLLLLIASALHAQEVRDAVISFGIRPDDFDRTQSPTDTPVGFAEPLEVRYPETAVRLRIEGITIVAAAIDGGGSVTYAEVRSSSGNAMLDSAALDAVIRGYYKAARRDGKAVESRITIPVEFRLGGNAERYQSDKTPEQLMREKQELEKAKEMLEDEERRLQEEIRILKEKQNNQRQDEK